ncbi:MAG: GIY-YIG nuclease family protein [Candidatus Roseilinea sp.]|nr:MAG: GIY-YIG nuclease family protein [Candidatus Roseilinea sp.]
MPEVYILRCADGSLYTGIAKDADARLKAHQAGHGGRYTRARRPVALVWRRQVATWREAMQFECAIKRLPRAKKLALIAASPQGTDEAGYLALLR